MGGVDGINKSLYVRGWSTVYCIAFLGQEFAWDPDLGQLWAWRVGLNETQANHVASKNRNKVLARHWLCPLRKWQINWQVVNSVIQEDFRNVLLCFHLDKKRYLKISGSQEGNVFLLIYLKLIGPWFGICFQCRSHQGLISWMLRGQLQSCRV